MVLGTDLATGTGALWAALSGICACLALVTLYVALRFGEASRVVPITAAYPVVTAILAAIVLSEQISFERGIGTVLVVAGVTVLTRY